MREKLKCGAESLQTDEKEFIFGAGGGERLIETGRQDGSKEEVRGREDKGRGITLRCTVHCTQEKMSIMDPYKLYLYGQA
jgi:hypothetical protein